MDNSDVLAHSQPKKVKYWFVNKISPCTGKLFWFFRIKYARPMRYYFHKNYSRTKKTAATNSEELHIPNSVF